MPNRILIDLWFSESEGEVALDATLFEHPYYPAPIRAHRGGIQPVGNGGTFSWTSAVRALALLLTKVAAHRHTGGKRPSIQGERGSLASSLDYAIHKQPLWLADMFGLDQNGQSLLRRLIRIVNPNRKRPGPVAIHWGGNDDCHVRVMRNNEVIASSSEFERILESLDGCSPPSGPRGLQTRGTAPRRLVLVSPAGDGHSFYGAVRAAFHSQCSGVLRYVPASFSPTVPFSSLEFWEIFRREVEERDDVAGVLMIPDNPDAHVERLVALKRTRQVP